MIGVSCMASVRVSLRGQNCSLEEDFLIFPTVPFICKFQKNMGRMMKKIEGVCQWRERQFFEKLLFFALICFMFKY